MAITVNGYFAGAEAGATYTAGTGLVLSGDQFSLDTSGATAGSYGPTAAVTGNDGTTMNVPYITVDKYGRVTSITNRVYTAKNTTYTGANGVTVSGTQISNSGVRAVTQGSTNGTVKVNTNGNTADVTVCEIATLAETKQYLGIS